MVKKKKLVKKADNLLKKKKKNKLINIKNINKNQILQKKNLRNPGISQKMLFFRLQMYFGINKSLANRIIALFGCSFNLKVNKINFYDKYFLGEIETFLRKHFLIEKILKDHIYLHLINHKNNRSYKGKRYGLLPVNGQRTKTNRQIAKKFNLKKFNIKYYKDIYKLDF